MGKNAKIFFLFVHGGVRVHPVILNPQLSTGDTCIVFFLLDVCMGTVDLAVNQQWEVGVLTP